mmetsp:Transcript_44916/g.43489  ORF Transcript_44916/g.43489 Transcript_44916/m.43489 type:complete len:89 (+) Transcript_44916:304-570(+)
MTMLQVIAVGIGSIFPFFLTQKVTYIISICLFLCIGSYMVFDSIFGTHEEEDEEKELVDEIAKKEGQIEPLAGDEEGESSNQDAAPKK